MHIFLQISLIPTNCVAIGCFRWKSVHFAVIDRKRKIVIYDPTPNSNTVKYGKLESIRLYKVKKGTKKMKQRIYLCGAIDGNKNYKEDFEKAETIIAETFKSYVVNPSNLT